MNTIKIFASVALATEIRYLKCLSVNIKFSKNAPAEIYDSVKTKQIGNLEHMKKKRMYAFICSNPSRF